MADMTVIILTMNEEKNIANCINSVKKIAKRIVVVDSGSTDQTLSIAEKLGADCYYHDFINYANQFNWGLDNTDVQTTWVLRLDADEMLTEELAEEMENAMLQHQEDDVNGMILKLKKSFLGRWLRHGGAYPFKKLMLFKNGIGRIEERNMDEHTVLNTGCSITLNNDALHNDFRDISYYIHKHNWYATREVLDYIAQNMQSSVDNLENGTLKARRKQKVVYYKLPKFFRAFMLFCYRYIFQLGFLDGKEGFIYHVLEDFWYRFLVDVKIFEYEKTGKINDKGGALK